MADLNINGVQYNGVEAIDVNGTRFYQDAFRYNDIVLLPANGSARADFNADNMSVQDLYDYLEVLIARYPNYIKKETMGKDASNAYDWNRYILYDGFYHAWQRQNYPKMSAWVNGSTVIYSVSVSPRVGDTL